MPVAVAEGITWRGMLYQKDDILVTSGHEFGRMVGAIKHCASGAAEVFVAKLVNVEAFSDGFAVCAETHQMERWPLGVVEVMQALCWHAREDGMLVVLA